MSSNAPPCCSGSMTRSEGFEQELRSQSLHVAVRACSKLGLKFEPGPCRHSHTAWRTAMLGRSHLQTCLGLIAQKTGFLP